MRITIVIAAIIAAIFVIVVTVSPVRNSFEKSYTAGVQYELTRNNAGVVTVDTVNYVVARGIAGNMGRYLYKDTDSLFITHPMKGTFAFRKLGVVK